MPYSFFPIQIHQTSPRQVIIIHYKPNLLFPPHKTIFENALHESTRTLLKYLTAKSSLGKIQCLNMASFGKGHRQSTASPYRKSIGVKL